MGNSDISCAFVIPLKPRSRSRDWAVTQRLLSACLECLIAQSEPDWVAYVVCSDEPTDVPRDERIRFLKFDDRAFEAQLPADWPDLRVRRADMRMKRLAGLIQARQDMARHAMFVDADDLIHRDIVKVLTGGDESRSVIINRGFKCVQGESGLVRSFSFHNISQTSMIFRLSDFDIPDALSLTALDECVLTRSHHLRPIEKILNKEGCEWRYLGFPGAIYVRRYGEGIRELYEPHAGAVGTPREPRQSGRQASVASELGRGNVQYVQRRILRLVAKISGRVPVSERLLKEFPGLRVLGH